MNIVLTLATPRECPNWQRLLLSSSPRARLDVVFTGIGMRRPFDDLRRRLNLPADLCIVAGLAGGLKNRHPVGAVLVARGIKTESSKTILTSDGALIDHAARQGATPVDFFYTSKTIVNSTAERSRLESIADAVDMESFAVFAEARRAGVPAVAIRVISDTPASPLPLNFERTVDDKGDLRWFAMAVEIAKQPARIGALMRFGVRSSHARRSLADFLTGYLQSLPVLQEEPLCR